MGTGQAFVLILSRFSPQPREESRTRIFTSVSLVTLPNLKSVTTSALIGGRQAGGFQTPALVFLLLHNSVPQSFLGWLTDWRAVDPLLPEYQRVTVINPLQGTHPGLLEGPDGSPAPRAASGPFLIKPPSSWGSISLAQSTCVQG